MPPRRQPTLLAQGKPRTLGGSSRPWRVRLYAPEAGGTKYQVMLRAPAGAGEPWKRVLRRANSEEEARKIFTQAEAALDTEKETPAGADVRAARTIRMLSEEYLKDSIERGKSRQSRSSSDLANLVRVAPNVVTFAAAGSGLWCGLVIGVCRRGHAAWEVACQPWHWGHS